MYKCGICPCVSEPHQPMHKHVIYREVLGQKQIAKEVPVCAVCDGLLHSGVPLSMLLQHQGGFKQVEPGKKQRPIVNEETPVYAVVNNQGKVTTIPKKKVTAQCDQCGGPAEGGVTSEGGLFVCMGCYGKQGKKRRTVKH